MEITMRGRWLLLAVPLLGARAPADDLERDLDSSGAYCSATAAALFKACGFEVRDDAAKAAAICLNISDPEERRECRAEARDARAEGEKTCRRQKRWRLAACERLGEERYDPEFDPGAFDDPRHPTHPNPYFPLQVGSAWEYRGGDEVNTVGVLDRTKLIDGVNCLVVNDQVFKKGDLVEDTDDWYAFAKDGSVWYCGEEVKDFESFDGDHPRLPELVSIDGSFKAGREGDKPGIIFQASPREGQAYLEEFSLANAEDVTEVLSTTYELGADPELDRFVPGPLVQLLCAGDCVVTKNYSLLEPGVVARKYYARGIGVFLEVDPDSGEVVRLTACNMDPRCSQLP
jgi:hypothetical protein